MQSKNNKDILSISRIMDEKCKENNANFLETMKMYKEFKKMELKNENTKIQKEFELNKMKLEMKINKEKNELVYRNINRILIPFICSIIGMIGLYLMIDIFRVFALDMDGMINYISNSTIEKYNDFISLYNSIIQNISSFLSFIISPENIENNLKKDYSNIVYNYNGLEIFIYKLQLSLSILFGLFVFISMYLSISIVNSNITIGFTGIKFQGYQYLHDIYEIDNLKQKQIQNKEQIQNKK